MAYVGVCVSHANLLSDAQALVSKLRRRRKVRAYTRIIMVCVYLIAHAMFRKTRNRHNVRDNDVYTCVWMCFLSRILGYVCVNGCFKLTSASKSTRFRKNKYHKRVHVYVFVVSKSTPTSNCRCFRCFDLRIFAF